MIRRTVRIWIAAAVLLGPAIASANSDALQRTKDLINIFLKVRSGTDAQPLSAPDRRANCVLFGQIDAYFDMETMMKSALAPNLDKFSPAELKSVTRDFAQIVRSLAYPGSGKFFDRAKYTMSGPFNNGDRSDVRMDVLEQGKDWETEVTYHWEMKNGKWMIVDASFDGDSLVVDYRNQFSRIIEQDGKDGFRNKLSEKLAEAVKKTPLCD